MKRIGEAKVAAKVSKVIRKHVNTNWIIMTFVTYILAVINCKYMYKYEILNTSAVIKVAYIG